MYVIRKTTTYTEPEKIAVSYFKIFELGVENYTGNIRDAFHFSTKAAAKSCIARLKRRSCDKNEIIKIEQEGE